MGRPELCRIVGITGSGGQLGYGLRCLCGLPEGLFASNVRTGSDRFSIGSILADFRIRLQPNPPALPRLLFYYSLDFRASSAGMDSSEPPEGVQLPSLDAFRVTAFSLISESVCRTLLQPARTCWSILSILMQMVEV